MFCLSVKCIRYYVQNTTESVFIDSDLSHLNSVKQLFVRHKISYNLYRCLGEFVRRNIDGTFSYAFPENRI